MSTREWNAPEAQWTHTYSASSSQCTCAAVYACTVEASSRPAATEDALRKGAPEQHGSIQVGLLTGNCMPPAECKSQGVQREVVVRGAGPDFPAGEVVARVRFES